VELSELPARDVRPLLTAERADLPGLLNSLGGGDWAKPTEAGRRTVKDVAPHVLDGLLGGQR
jgi:hypothetical protein